VGGGAERGEGGKGMNEGVGGEEEQRLGGRDCGGERAGGRGVMGRMVGGEA